ncbi:MAG: MerR family DNA-binding protein [Reyranellaceae bacterium]
MPALATIGIDVLAERSGLDAKTIHDYERQGLIPRPRKVAGIPPLYRTDDVDTLKFAHRALGLGFTPRAIRDLLRLEASPSAGCGAVYDLAQKHLADIDRRIAELTEIRRRLAPLVESCPREDVTIGECPILKGMHAAAEAVGPEVLLPL